MNLSLVPVFYALVAIATLWLALLSCARVKPGRRTRVATVLIGVATVCLLLVPVGGLPLWNRVFSVHPNPSIPLLGIVCAALWQRLLGIAIFRPADWRAVWVFGVGVGTVLYLNPIIFGAVDLYYWGWERDAAIWSLAAVAVLLLARGSRLGVLFLAALIAFAVTALESQNCWDYVMDPFYWLISVAVAGKRVVGWATRRLFRRFGAGAATREVAAVSAPVVALCLPPEPQTQTER